MSAPLAPLAMALFVTTLSLAAHADAPTDPDLQQRINALEERLAVLEAQPAPADAPLTHAARVVIPPDESVDDAIGLAGPVDVYGTVLGNAIAMGADVRVHDGGRVIGDAIAFGGQVEIDRGGEVVGDRVAIGDTSAGLGEAVKHSAAAWVADAARRLSLMLSFSGVGVLVVAFWPQQVSQVSRLLITRPGWYGLGGMILLAALATAGVVLTLSVVGLPISLMLAVLIGVAWLIGFVATCKALGDRFGFGDTGGWAAFLLGAAVLSVVSFIPWVGPALLALLSLPAVGAALISRLGNRTDPDTF